MSHQFVLLFLSLGLITICANLLVYAQEESIEISDSVKVEVKSGSEVEEVVEIEDKLEVQEGISVMEEKIKSPRKQMAEGVAATDVVCNEGLELILKSTDGSAACVKPSSAPRLIEIGWGMPAV